MPYEINIRTFYKNWTQESCHNVTDSNNIVAERIIHASAATVYGLINTGYALAD